MLSLLICLLSAGDSLTAVAGDGGKLSKAEIQFTTELFLAVAKTRYTENVFLSPHDVYSALLTVYVASAGKTEKSLQNFLRFDQSSIPDKKLIIDEYFHSTKLGTNYSMYPVDRIYYSPDFKVKKDKQLQFGVKTGVFKTRNNREEEINKWVSKNTEGNIQNLFKKGEINPGSTVVFVTASYFKGYWVIPLNGGTSKRPFTLHDGTVTETLFMSVKHANLQSMTVPYLNAKIFSLPYIGDDIEMIIVMPTAKPQKNASPPLADVVKKLTFNKLQDTLTAFKTEKFCTTEVFIPKFESEEKYELKQIFEALGDKELFTQDMDLTDLFEPGTNLRVGSIVHQAKVNVYEYGTEAAAATAVNPLVAAKPVCPTTFKADHPFVYLIYDKKRQTVQYIGIFNTPKK